MAVCHGDMSFQDKNVKFSQRSSAGQYDRILLLHGWLEVPHNKQIIDK